VLNRDGFKFGFPPAGAWKLHLHLSWEGYSALFGSHPSTDVVALPGERDGLPNHAAVTIGPYSVLVYSRTSPLLLRITHDFPTPRGPCVRCP
jgi:1,4-alpha-glucan branching enzyme